MVKTNIYISSIIKLSLIFCIFITIVSCKNDFESTYSLGNSENGLNKEVHDNDENDISQFLISVAEIYREEIQMCKLAQQKGNNEHVLELCKGLEMQHQTILNDLNQFAEERKIYLPSQFSSYSKDTYYKLNMKGTGEFDKAYCEWLIISQIESIALFEEASNDTTDMEINAWAKGVLPILKKKLNYSIACHKKIERV